MQKYRLYWQSKNFTASVSDNVPSDNDLTHHRRSRESQYFLFTCTCGRGGGAGLHYCDDCEYLYKFMVPTAGTWCLHLKWCHRRNEEGVNHPLQESKTTFWREGVPLERRRVNIAWEEAKCSGEMAGFGCLVSNLILALLVSRLFFQNGKSNDGWEISLSLLLSR